MGSLGCWLRIDFCPSCLCGSAKSHTQGTQGHFLYHFLSTSQERLDLVQEHIQADLSNTVRGFRQTVA